MKSSISFSLLTVLLALTPAIAPAQAPPGCSWEGDPAFRYGWNYLEGLPYHQPGPDTVTIFAGQTLEKGLWPCGASASWLPAGCKAADTLCFHATSASGWTLSGDPPFGTAEELPGPGYYWPQFVYITAPCSAAIGDVDTVIAIVTYTNVTGVCDPTCGDCNDPNIRPADGLRYYSRDTLYVTVVEPPPALGVFQDTLSFIGRGQTQAYVPFTICNQNECAPLTAFNYSILTTGHIPTTIPGSSVDVEGGDCADVYAVLDAGYAGSVKSCTFDTLTIIAWTGTAYDTCVQIVHVIEECCGVPILSAPAMVILLVALAAVVAIFVKRRFISTS